AAQAAVLQTTIGKVRAAMRTAAADQTVTAFGVLEDHQIFAEQPHRLDRAVAAKLIHQSRRLPIASHQRTGRRTRADASNEIVLLRTQHETSFPFHVWFRAFCLYDHCAATGSGTGGAKKNGRRKPPAVLPQFVASN